MFIHDYERMSPPTPSSRPLKLESKLARARQADARKALYRRRASIVRTLASRLWRAAEGWVSAFQLSQKRRVGSDLEA